MKHIRMHHLLSRAAVLLLCLLGMTFAVPATVQANSAGMTIYGIYLSNNDVGDPDGGDGGDATLIESGGKYLLMDIGRASKYEKVKAFLDKKVPKGTPISLYFSHYHGDHTGGLGTGEGLDRLLSDFTIDRIYIPSVSLAPELNYSKKYTEICNLYKKYYPSASLNEKIIQLSRGMSFSFGNANVNIIGPFDFTSSDVTGYSSESRKMIAYANNYSLVAKITAGGMSYLTAGDIELKQEQLLLQNYGSNGALKADIFKMSHHGNLMSNSASFLASVSPSYVYAPNNGYAAGNNTINGVERRWVASSLYNCSQYGFTYLVGSSKKSIAYTAEAGKVTASEISEDNSTQNTLSGLVKIAGSDGVNQKYDYYYLENGLPYKGVRTIDGKKYAFGSGGCRESGTYSYNGTYNPWRGFAVDGVTKYRYFDQKTAEMKTGWMDLGGLFYYFDDNTGYRYTGINKVNGNVYNFTADGTVVRSQWATVNGKKYYLTADGTALTGWQTVNKKTYYFVKNEGYRAKGLTKVGSRYYYFYSNGTYAKNKTIKIKSDRLNFNENGYLINIPQQNNRVNRWKLTGQPQSLQVKWNPISKTTGYKIYISEKKNTGYRIASVVTGGKTSSAYITGLTTGKSYYVKIRAYRELDTCTFNSSFSTTQKARVR